MGRPKKLGEMQIMSVRLEKDVYDVISELSAFHSTYRGRVVSIQELIRQALRYVYMDNECLRECFRRSRRRTSGKWRIRHE